VEDLGPRERQIMAIIYRLGRATATEVQAELPVSPSNSAVRGMLRLLEEKGHLKHEHDGLVIARRQRRRLWCFVYLYICGALAGGRSLCGLFPRRRHAPDLCAHCMNQPWLTTID